MSGPANDQHVHHDDPQAADAVDYGKVITVGVSSLLLFAVAIWWASIVYRHEREDVAAKKGNPRPVNVTSTEIGIVDQVPFAADGRLGHWQAERKAYLGGYGWVDRGRGLVHIPVDMAVDQIIAGGGPAGAPK